MPGGRAWTISARRAGKFFERLDRVLVLLGMTGTRTHVRKAQLLQETADRHLIQIDLEARLDLLSQVDTAPAHHAVHLGIGSLQYDPANRLLLRRVELGLATRRLGVDQPVDTLFVVGVHPIAQRLAIHAADPGRFLAALSFAHGGKRKQAARLVGILRLDRQLSERPRTMLSSQLDSRRHPRPHESVDLNRSESPSHILR